MSEKQVIIDQIVQVFRDSHRILFTAGANLDGDAFGSLLALDEVARSLGKETCILNDKSLDSYYSFIPDHTPIVPSIPDGFTPDLIVITDTGDLALLGRIYQEYRSIFESVVIVNIDHHSTNTEFGTYNLIDLSVSSACELTAEVIEAIIPETQNACFSKTLSSYLMLGVFYDTNCFRNQNTNAKTFAFMSRLLACGACYFTFVKHLYKSRSIAEMRLYGHLLDHAIVYGDNGAVGCIIDQATLLKYGVGEDSLASVFNNEFLSTILCDFSFVVKESDDGRYKISLRTSKDGYDVSRLAQLLGGGGHVKAAGAITTKSLPEILNVIETYYSTWQTEKNRI